MRRIYKLSLLLLFISSKTLAFDHEHKPWTKVLAKHLDEQGLVDYSGIKGDNSALSQYLDQLESISYEQYSSWSDSERKAFLINAYNAFTFKLIVDHYPVKSIRDIGSIFKSPWQKKFFSLLEGRIKTLDQIEHDELRKKFEDYRIHAAVNCASKSCPPLRAQAFTASNFDTELDDQMKLWLADSQRNKFERGSRKIKLSMIFKWYRSDFEAWGGGVEQVLRHHAPPEARELLANNAKITFLPYDWSLNDAAR